MIVLEKDVKEQDIEAIFNLLREYGLTAQQVSGATGISTLQIIGEEPPELIHILPGMAGVAEYVPVNKPFKIVSREHHPEYKANGDARIVRVGNVEFGGENIVIIAGPCAGYNLEQILETASIAKEGGAHMLRGGAYKPRTSPHSFRGVGKPALEMLAEARARTGLPFVTEVLDPRDVELVAQYADMFQIGTRNMQNQALLIEVGRTKRPVLLKRGYWATIEEWLQAAEWVASEGNKDIVLNERGIRTLSNPSGGRFSLDVQAIPVARELTYLPVIADPSHSAGRALLVPGNALAALEAGAHGLEIDIMRQDEKPTISYSLNGKTLRAGYVDYAQALRPDAFYALMQSLHERNLNKVRVLH